jgi:cysteine desulfurase/selenocysteine lyase
VSFGSPPPAYSPTVRPQGSDSAESPYAAPGSGGSAIPRVPGFPASHADPSIGGRSLSAIRADFPILAEKVNGQDLVWLDNAATAQRPQAVIDRLAWYYQHENSNVHRGVHELADRSTNAYEEASAKVARFIGAPSTDNIVFVRGTTEGINLISLA